MEQFMNSALMPDVENNNKTEKNPSLNNLHLGI